MKLFLISQTENMACDTYDRAVVCAPDESTARLMSPSGENGELHTFGQTWDHTWCSSPDKVSVKYIGEAAPTLPVGVVCASFDAG